MELTETRGRKPKYDFSAFTVGDVLTYEATGRNLKKGVATHQFATKVTARVQAYSKRNGLGWKVARRTFGAKVEISIMA